MAGLSQAWYLERYRETPARLRGAGERRTRFPGSSGSNRNPPNGRFPLPGHQFQRVPCRHCSAARRAISYFPGSTLADKRVDVAKCYLESLQRANRCSASVADIGRVSNFLTIVLHDGEHQARGHTSAGDQYGAGAALAVVATLLGAGEIEVVT